MIFVHNNIATSTLLLHTLFVFWKKNEKKCGWMCGFFFIWKESRVKPCHTNNVLMLLSIKILRLKILVLYSSLFFFFSKGHGHLSILCLVSPWLVIEGIWPFGARKVRKKNQRFCFDSSYTINGHKIPGSILWKGIETDIGRVLTLRRISWHYCWDNWRN